jgi:hypothetical protein
VISSNELKMDPENERAIKEWLSPRSMFEVRSFHGIESFYRKFIRYFNGICAPMMDIVKKMHLYFKWTEEADKSFNMLKNKITERPILVLPNFEKTFQVRCDASGIAIGAVLRYNNRPIAYLSEKLNETKGKYSTYDKDIYVIIQTLNK